MAALKLQEATFGLSTEAAARMAAAQQLVNRYTAEGKPITEGTRRAIEAYAVAAGKVVAVDEERIRKQREVIGGLDDIRSASRGTFTGLVSDLAKGKNPVEGLTSSLDGLTNRFVDRFISAPITSGLFGQEGKAGGGLFGDTIAGAFGKQVGLSTADITAGIVNVNGTVSGFPGLATAAAAGAAPSTGSLKPGSDELASYIRGSAVARGIDPDIALRVAKSEGFGSFVGDRTAEGTPSSFGPFQLHYATGRSGPLSAPGLGDLFTRTTGLDARDPSTTRQQIDFALDQAAKGGWGPWYGAKKVGIGRWEGIGSSPALPEVANPGSGLDASLRQVGPSATEATQGLAALSKDLTALPGPLDQTSEGLTKLSSSLGSGGGGLLEALTKAFGGASGAAAGETPATVAAAGGGLLIGPGTGTSDSILARVSNGEFMVNAAATARHLPLLRAINENRLPAFAAGGFVGQAGPPSARYAARQDGSMAVGAGDPKVEMHVHDYAGAGVQRRTSRNAQGQPRVDLAIGKSVADQIGRPGSPVSEALQQHFGLQRSMAGR